MQASTCIRAARIRSRQARSWSCPGLTAICTLSQSIGKGKSVCRQRVAQSGKGRTVFQHGAGRAGGSRDVCFGLRGSIGNGKNVCAGIVGSIGIAGDVCFCSSRWIGNGGNVCSGNRQRARLHRLPPSTRTHPAFGRFGEAPTFSPSTPPGARHRHLSRTA
ncbi:MAG: hypothetical protein JWL90_4315 [Chthoniobacteraceae bacterium]|nr:hypothetical protein [Chthoniobacteraceae bacterium]